ncbi:hypothetical protein G5B47_02340 [Paenibacillus sp. 7124]|uniref:Uncharacterized protein n=1 Tax=Paenibacillus apii TaxID=1850370 RepID=A0A6M1PDE7_9BACL|nr:hypothetical protein [Paenibacillus apii]NGM81247.1 hypothetical protein [Paenibacillus apii]
MSDDIHVTTEEGEIVDVKSQLTVGINLRKSAELGPAAHDVAAFINTVRDLTAEDYALDVRVQVGVDAESVPGRNADGTPVVGFLAQQHTEDYGEEDDGNRTSK